MKTILVILCVGNAVFFALRAYRATYWLGYWRGKLEGKKTETDWWLRAEQEVGEVRQKIWMEDD